jgi:hypothetical protein
VSEGDGSPGSREAEGEGGEGFYIAQSGRCPDLLVILGGGGGEEVRQRDDFMAKMRGTFVVLKHRLYNGV